ncbi:hypothetical protein [Sinorhizobium glycinis]|nr:hypothetical protein [Sinorhizobium glycinis]
MAAGLADHHLLGELPEKVVVSTMRRTLSGSGREAQRRLLPVLQLL